MAIFGLISKLAHEPYQVLTAVGQTALLNPATFHSL